MTGERQQAGRDQDVRQGFSPESRERGALWQAVSAGKRRRGA